MKPLIIEQITKPLILVTEEVANVGGKMFMKGKIQQTSVNQNNREYPKELWEQLFADPDYLDKKQRGTLIGGIGHPKDGIFDAKEGCLVTREMELMNDGDVDGILEILLKHPHGMILGIYYESGVFYPVSSRGRGDSDTKNDGTIVVTPGTYVYEGHDAVIDPSVKDATPDYVKEALAKKENFVKYADLVRQKIAEEKIDPEFVKTVKRMTPLTFQFHETVKDTSNNYKDLAVLIESKNAEITGTGTSSGKTTVIFDSKDIESLHKELKMVEEKIDKILKPSNQTESTQTTESVDINNSNQNKTTESMSVEKKTVEQLQEELTAANKKLDLSETSGKVTALTEKFETAKKILEGSEKKVTSLTNENLEEKKKHEMTNTRLNASKSLLAASLKKSFGLKQENAELKAKYEAASKIIIGLNQQMEGLQRNGIGKVIAHEVSRFPEAMRVKAKVAFSECKTPDSVQKLSESMLSMLTAMGDTTLPFNQNRSNQEQNENATEKQRELKRQQEFKDGDELSNAIARIQEEKEKQRDLDPKVRALVQ